MKQTLLGYPLALGAAGCFVAGESSGFLIKPAISSRPSPGNHVPFCKGREDELRDDMRLGFSPRLPRVESFPCNREQNLVCWGVGHWFAFHLTVEKMSGPDLQINSKCPKTSPHDFCLGTDLPDHPMEVLGHAEEHCWGPWPLLGLREARPVGGREGPSGDPRLCGSRFACKKVVPRNLFELCPCLLMNSLADSIDSV